MVGGKSNEPACKRQTNAFHVNCPSEFLVWREFLLKNNMQKDFWGGKMLAKGILWSFCLFE
jgi:hypothetical protein